MFDFSKKVSRHHFVSAMKQLAESIGMTYHDSEIMPMFKVDKSPWSWSLQGQIKQLIERHNGHAGEMKKLREDNRQLRQDYDLLLTHLGLNIVQVNERKVVKTQANKEAK